jgi:hypothetical protein
MSIREIIDWAIDQANGDLIGIVASDFYQSCPDGSGSWVWACDVDIGASVLDNGSSDNVTVGTGTSPNVLQAVPVAANNQEIIYAQQGTAVALRKLSNGRYAIVGLAKTSQGLGHVIYMSFTEDIAQVVTDQWHGVIIRPLTLGELGTLAPQEFGSLPMGAQGRFDAQGNLISILGT